MTRTQQLATFSPIIVPGSGQCVDLTVVLPLRGCAAELSAVVEELSAALYAQCITFEVQAVLDEGMTALEQEWDCIFEASSARWVGFFGFPAGVPADPYEFIEALHQAREAASLI